MSEEPITCSPESATSSQHNCEAATKARDALLNAIAQQAREVSDKNPGQASKALEELSRAFANVLAVQSPVGTVGTTKAPPAIQVPLAGGSIAGSAPVSVQSDNPSEVRGTPTVSEGTPQIQSRAGGHQVGLCIELEP